MKVGELGERGLIELLSGLTGSARDVVVGIGDDSAVVSAGGEDLVLTSDPVIEGVHFSSGIDPCRIGHKAVGRVLSDMAAMGAAPAWLLMNVVAPEDLDVEVLHGIYQGARDLLCDFDAAIIGGDVAQGETLQLHVFGVGRLPEGTAVLRSGAKEENRIFVTGELGGSLQGKHLDFVPRVREGLWLREGEWVNAMIDVSDGLLSELRHVAKSSQVDVLLDLDAVPISGAAGGMQDERSSLEHALCDGEDFELLFTVPEGRCAALVQTWAETFELRLSCLGRIVAGKGQIRNNCGEQISFPGRNGYEHFRC